MKSFFRIFPFIFVFLLVLGLQTKWGADSQVKPYLEPFGRESAAGHSSVNRAPQPLGENRYVWLGDNDLVFTTIGPTKQGVQTEHRPAPADDLFSHTLYSIVGDDIFWVGNDDQLKRATWQNGKWSAPVEIAQHAYSLYATQVGSQKVLMAGINGTLNIWSVSGEKVTLMHSYPVKKVTNISGTVDANGNLQIGAIDELGASLVNLLTFSVDATHLQPSSLTVVDNLSMPSSMMVQDSTFGIDKTHGYFLITFMNTRSMAPQLTAYTFTLSTRSDFKQVKYPGEQQPTLYSAYVASSQGDSLTVVTAGDYAKNPRVSGKEVFVTSLQDGVWKQGLQRVSNSHGVAVNPVFDKAQNGTTTVLFMLQNSYEQFDLYYNSDDKAYATATNQEVKADYTKAMMNAPQYMGIAAIISFMVIAWPLLSYAYLFYFVVKRREDELYDKAERHLLIAIVLHFICEVFVFLNYAKLDNIRIYAPEWMHGYGGLAGVLFLLGVVAYVLTKVFYSRLRYERQALPEFTYYFAINAWTVLLGFSYFMAT